MFQLPEHLSSCAAALKIFAATRKKNLWRFRLAIYKNRLASPKLNRAPSSQNRVLGALLIGAVVPNISFKADGSAAA